LKSLPGFTLLELLVALAIFAVIATIAYSGLNTILTVNSQVEQQATQLAQIQMAFAWLARDIEQLIERPIRDEYGDTQPILQQRPSYLEFTHAGWRNPAQQQRSSLQRVAYYRQGNTWWRAYWWMLDRAPDSQPIKVELLNDVNDLQFRFLDAKLQWHQEWPPLDRTMPTTETEINQVLTAIEVTLNVVKWGRLTRLFRVPDGYPKNNSPSK
jgi:general secretion pathway protein J